MLLGQWDEEVIRINYFRLLLKIKLHLVYAYWCHVWHYTTVQQDCRSHCNVCNVALYLFCIFEFLLPFKCCVLVWILYTGFDLVKDRLNGTVNPWFNSELRLVCGVPHVIPCPHGLLISSPVSLKEMLTLWGCDWYERR